MYKVDIEYRFNSEVTLDHLHKYMPIDSLYTNRDGSGFNTSFYKPDFESAKSEVDLQIKTNTTNIVPKSYTIYLTSKEDYKFARATIDVQVMPSWITPRNDSEQRYTLANIIAHLYNFGYVITSFSEDPSRPDFSSLTASKDYDDLELPVEEQLLLVEKIPVISYSLDVAPLETASRKER